MEENVLFNVRERRIFKTIPVWFIFVCGIFYACQLILSSISNGNIYVYSTLISININTYFFTFLGGILLALLLIFIFYSHTALLFKISTGLTILCSLILCIPFSPSFLSIVLYLLIGFIELNSILLIALVIKEFNITSVFKNCFISLISGCALHTIYSLFNFNMLFPVLILLTLSGALILWGAIKLFPNKSVIAATPRISRIYSDKERKHNPYLGKKQKISYPIKTTVALVSIVVGCAIINSINGIKLSTLNLPTWVFYACATLGGIIFAIIFTFYKKYIFRTLFVYFGVIFISTVLLFIDVFAVQCIGACLFYSCLIAFSLNTFYASILFSEVPTKLVLFSTLILQIFANVLATSLLNNLNSSVVVMAIILILTIAVVAVLAFAGRFINHIWQTSLSPTLAINPRLKDALTETEFLIFDLMVLGYTRKQISSILYLKPDTINSYLGSIVSKIWSSGLSNQYMKSFKNK